ncbi:uncharacterized protein BXZ73DRAFT_86426 [Epithele typhae]|uniref:uncharacterized protein n=1 Tax=Epithele typhae TaxID=378194 RepID=UPI0020083A0B|nr:uncharacterized protein BXZ73DRAFT_86426 [Epithele typhae]KAH9946260.1 hypothetical protein BXZ73DRAFT_86426 [Epithele typhae]
MLSPVIPPPSQLVSTPHSYETRTRSNTGIRPSIRLRHSPDSAPSLRRLKPAQSTKLKQNAFPLPLGASQPVLPPFPPPHVVLHADDAGSKVFLAMGRALVSVDNRAMTVKDLSEMSMKCGLNCQNLSAAGQAITTFIRNHLQRCEVQQDQPLLLRHVMSGTAADDDLVAALYSRVGGAHCTHPEGEGRLTNFRRGTMVWYLSKAAGAPCPFSRAGIRLCDYNENGKIGMPINPGREKKRERDRMRKAAQTAGQKRKRLLRSCADHPSESETDSSDEEEKRPMARLRLTLRLKPSGASDSARSESRLASLPPAALESSGDEDHDVQSDDSDSSMSVDSDADDSSSASPSPVTAAPYIVPDAARSLPGLPPCSPHTHHTPYRRSSSVSRSALSVSTPPDSEAEDEDFHITMTGIRRRSLSRAHTPFDDAESASEDGFFGDIDFDAETQWESPGPRSPSVQLEDDVVVKEEPTDVRGLLDAWEDLDNKANHLKVIDVVAQAAAAERQAEQSSSCDMDAWAWPSMQPGDSVYIKQEEVEPRLFFTDTESTPPPEALSPAMSFDPCESPIEERPIHIYGGDMTHDMQWRNVEILGPDSVQLHDLDAGAWREYRGVRATSPEERVHSPSPGPSIVPATSPPTSPIFPRTPLALEMPSGLVQERNLSITSPTLLASLTSLSIQATSTTPLSRYPTTLSSADCSSLPATEGSVVIHPIQPIYPPICVVELEGVAVYQTVLGGSTLLRRVDSDFVNLSPIAERLTSFSTAEAVTISVGSPLVCGTWVPLALARELAKDEPSLKGFLSDDLRSIRATTCPTFGHQFKSASDARRLSMSSHRLELPPREYEAPWDDHLTTHPSFNFPTTVLDAHRPTTEDMPAIVEAPLSPSEEEMFHALCAAAEWDANACVVTLAADNRADGTLTSPCPPGEGHNGQEQPLRRSKRVAHVSTRSRTRTSKRGSRTSLS